MVRCSVTGADVPSVVVKLHVDAPGRESHVREPAGLEVLTGAEVPRLLPEPVVLSALTTWRERVPYGGTESFQDDLRVVTVGWTLLTTAWFLPTALDGDHTHGDVTPPRRAMLQRRRGLAAAVLDPRLLTLTALCEQVLQASYDVSGQVSLELAPAFRG